MWEKEQGGQAASPTAPPPQGAGTRGVPPAFLPRAEKDPPGQRPPEGSGGISIALRLPSRGHGSAARR